MVHDSETKDGYVYIFQNPETMETYVGSTGDLDKRLKEHRRDLNRSSHPNRKFQNAYNRNPNFEVLSVSLQSRDEAFDLEQAILDEYGPGRLLLNISKDARAPIFELTPEVRTRMSDAAKQRMISPETREKMKIGNTGKVRSEEVRRKMSERVHPPEIREKLSQSMRGNQNGLGTKIPQESLDARRLHFIRPVVIDGRVFESHGDAARHYGVTATTVTNRIKNPKFESWGYLPNDEPK